MKENEEMGIDQNLRHMMDTGEETLILGFYLI